MLCDAGRSAEPLQKTQFGNHLAVLVKRVGQFSQMHADDGILGTNR